MNTLGGVSASWDEAVVCLARFRAKHGHVRVPRETFCSHCGFGLGRWVDAQRKAFAHNALPNQRIAQLAAMGLHWHVFDEAWLDQYSELLAFIDEHGHTLVPQRYQTQDGGNLGRWVNEQRRRRRNGSLSAERFELLDEVGFEWDAKQAEWDLFCREFVRYVRTYGHGRVPQHYRSPSGVLLGRWVSNRRCDRNAHRLSPEVVDQLSVLGFDWSAQPYRRDRA